MIYIYSNMIWRKIFYQ